MPKTRVRQARKIPVSSPLIGHEELRFVSRAIREGWVSSRGPFVDEFERRFAGWVRGNHGVSTTSGTTALHLALATLGVGPGDEVILPDFTIVACADAVLYTGARPVFVDVDPRTWTISPEHVARRLSKRTRVIMPVHMYGHPADLDPLRRMAQDYSVAIVEDAAEAHGSLYRGQRVGALGTLGCFSFYSNKLLTTGEGGMVVTQSKRLAERARLLRDLAFANSIRDYHHASVAFNYRMTNLQAALGLAQIERLTENIRHRRECAQLYHDILLGTPGLELPTEAPWARSVYWMYTIRVLGGQRRRQRLMTALAKHGIETRVGFWPLHLQPFLAAYSSPKDNFEVSEQLGRQTLSLPSGNGITTSDVEHVARILRQVVRSTIGP